MDEKREEKKRREEEKKWYSLAGLWSLCERDLQYKNKYFINIINNY